MAGNFKTDFSARGFLHCGDEDRARYRCGRCGNRARLRENPVQRLAHQGVCGETLRLSHSHEPGLFLRLERQTDGHGTVSFHHYAPYALRETGEGTEIQPPARPARIQHPGALSCDAAALWGRLRSAGGLATGILLGSKTWMASRLGQIGRQSSSKAQRGRRQNEW
jgi:hypothetical protein